MLIHLQAPQAQDTLRHIIVELDGVPHLGDDNLKDARDTAITLELTNRFAHVHGVFYQVLTSRGNLTD